MKVEDAFFQCQPEDELNELLMKVLLSVGVSAVAIPDHVSRAVDKYSPRKTEIQPDLIRYVLRQLPSSYVNLGRKEKLLLLKFSLSDGQFSDLEGLQLLPLSNGDFLKFEARARTVFISSKEHPQELFPGLDERFLDRGVDEKILDNLSEAVDQGTTKNTIIVMPNDSENDTDNNHKSIFFISDRTREPSLRTLKSHKSRTYCDFDSQLETGSPFLFSCSFLLF